MDVWIGKHQPAIKSVHFPTKSPSLSMHFCHNSIFKEFVNNNGWLPGLPHWFHGAGLPSDTLWRWKDGSTREPGTECKVHVERVPSCSSEFCMCIGGWCGAECRHIAGWFFSSIYISLAVHNKPLGWLRQWAALMVSSCGEYSTNMRPTASQKRACIILCGESILFGFFFLGHALWCHSMLCSSSKCSQFLSLFITLWGKSSPPIAFRCVNCEEIFFGWI